MSFPETGILDSFDRADGPLGADWVTSPGLSALAIVSNQVTGTIGGTDEEYYNSLGTTGPDCEIHATIATPPSVNKWATLRARWTFAPNVGYYLLWRRFSGPDRLDLKESGGGITATANVEMVAGAKFGMRLTGTAIEGWYKLPAGIWTQAMRVVDSAHSGAGYLVLGATDTVVRLDDFGGGSFEIIAPNPADLILAAVARRGFVTSGEGRQVARYGLAQLLKEALVSTYAQAVYHYLKADFAGLSPVVVVASGGTRRQPYTAQGTRPTYNLTIHTFTRYAVPGTDWSEEDAELRMDVLDCQIGVILKANKGQTPYWKRIDYSEFTACGDVVVGGFDYRHEITPITVEAF